jgi:hypothetical protein
VNYAYAGEDQSLPLGECGNNVVYLNAYDNTLTPGENNAKGAYDGFDPGHPMGNQPGTGTVGTWSIISGPTACGGGSFSDENDPDATFTGEAGTYTLGWTVGSCTSTVSITITMCSVVDFDGTDDHVQFNNSYNIGSTFSIECWIKPESVSGLQTIYSKRDANNLNDGYDLRLTGSTLSFNWNNGGSIASPYNLSTSRWYHTAVTFGGGSYKLYIDGILVNTSNGATPTTNGDDFLFGAMAQTGSPPNDPVNYYNGWIDEVRIWNKTLHVDHIRQMMNQQIINNGASVEGEAVPIIIHGPDNDGNGSDDDVLNWANLDGYYRMDQINCGHLEPFNAIGTNGRLMNITTAQEETAPLPYTSRIDNQQWGTDNSWTHFSVWDPPNSTGVDGATAIDWNIAQVSHNMSSGNRDITLLALLLDTTGKMLTMAEPSEALDEFNDGQGLWITHYLLLDGNIDLVGESQLVQKRYQTTQYSPSILVDASSGYLERDQQGTRSSFNYNYWASPVSYQGAPNNAPYTIASMLMDGTDSQNPGPISFGGQWDWAYADGPLSSPIKLSNYWFWKFNGNDDDYDSWQHVGATGSILAGEGYTQKGTDGTASILDRQNYVFRGKPNNETIQLGIAVGDNRFIGNPYPSAIDAHEFIWDNIADGLGRAPTNIIEGALYFWDHFAGATHILREYIGGYAVYNLIGGNPAISTDYRINATGGTSNNIPERYVAVGQGFFVVAISGGNISFKNSQRDFTREVITGDNTGSYFFKTSEKTTSKPTHTNNTIREQDNRERIRLTFTSPLGYHRQLLVGVDENATNYFDLGFDAPMIEDNKEDMYWLVDKNKFLIQGVNNFDLTQELPLGIKVNEAGTISIKVKSLENIDEVVPGKPTLFQKI